MEIDSASELLVWTCWSEFWDGLIESGVSGFSENCAELAEAILEENSRHIRYNPIQELFIGPTSKI